MQARLGSLATALRPLTWKVLALVFLGVKFIFAHVPIAKDSRSLGPRFLVYKTETTVPMSWAVIVGTET